MQTSPNTNRKPPKQDTMIMMSLVLLLLSDGGCWFYQHVRCRRADKKGTRTTGVSVGELMVVMKEEAQSLPVRIAMGHPGLKEQMTRVFAPILIGKKEGRTRVLGM